MVQNLKRSVLQGQDSIQQPTSGSWMTWAGTFLNPFLTKLMGVMRIPLSGSGRLNRVGR